MQVEEATERMEELSSEDVTHLRDLAKTNTYFLAKAVLQYDQVELGAHGALCAFMDNEKSSRRMVLMPRGFLKTTICTITNSIKLSLANPNIRILIQNEVFENAAGFLEEIKNHWQRTFMLGALFPELRPTRYMGPGADWTKSTASILRTTIARESTYTVTGSGGSPQSQHFEVVKNDDLIGERARNSDVEMKKAITWSDAMRPLLDRLSDQMDFYGTRKTLTDVYAHIQRKYASQIKVFIRLPIEDGESIFSKHPVEELMNIMVDTPDLWAYDYMNNPMGEGGFDWGPNYTQYFALGEDLAVRFVDPQLNVVRKWEKHELYVVITIDPNGGKATAEDKAAIIVHGVSPEEQIFVLEAWDGRPSPDGLIDKVMDLAEKWGPQVIGTEEAGQQNQLYYLEKRMGELQRYYTLKPTKHMNKEKSIRIRTALDSPLKKQKLFFQRHQLTLVTQVQMHPQLAKHNWDLIDCLAQGPQVYQSGMSQTRLDEQREAESKILDIRGVTGYGSTIRRFSRA